MISLSEEYQQKLSEKEKMALLKLEEFICGACNNTIISDFIFMEMGGGSLKNKVLDNFLFLFLFLHFNVFCFFF